MDTKLEKIVSSLTEREKQSLRELLDEDLKGRNGNRAQRHPRRFGWAQGRIRVAADFDAPLDDFKEYMQ